MNMYTQSLLNATSKEVESYDYLTPDEKPLLLYINGGFYSSAMISPWMEKEFIIGHLYSEGLIKKLEDIKEFEIEGNIAIVELRKRNFQFSSKVILSGCGGAGAMIKNKLPKVESNIEITKDIVYYGIRDALSSRLYQKTRGIHKCTFINQDFLILSAEDIGRHNAIDKAIGIALLKNMDMSKFCAATTGRISSEMALKCSMANIPVLATKTSITSFAIEISEATGLTTVAFVSQGRMKILTHGYRVKGSF
ncbi:MAG: formate dehydrogenase accessory sulfurtransferase FdhD [Deltaproteobacteria bacterium]|nr:formate dehydrogenase accessory sulfurtransferase FdhD [Deltaproteobacteria bacterium]